MRELLNYPLHTTLWREAWGDLIMMVGFFRFGFMQAMIKSERRREK